MTVPTDPYDQPPTEGLMPGAWCETHNVFEVDMPGDYRSCLGCSHVWRTEEEFREDCQSAGLDPLSTATCPLCFHDL